MNFEQLKSSICVYLTSNNSLNKRFQTASEVNEYLSKSIVLMQTEVLSFFNTRYEAEFYRFICDIFRDLIPTNTRKIDLCKKAYLECIENFFSLNSFKICVNKFTNIFYGRIKRNKIKHGKKIISDNDKLLTLHHLMNISNSDDFIRIFGCNLEKMQYLKSNIDGLFDTFNTILKNKNKSQIQPKQISDSLQLLFNYYQNNKICSNNLFDDEFESAIEFYREKLNLRNPLIQNTSKGKANSNGIFYSYLSGKRDYHFVIGQSTFYVCSSLVEAIENMMKINLMMPKFQFTGKTNYLFQLVGLVGSIDHNYLKKRRGKIMPIVVSLSNLILDDDHMDDQDMAM